MTSWSLLLTSWCSHSNDSTIIYCDNELLISKTCTCTTYYNLYEPCNYMYMYYKVCPSWVVPQESFNNFRISGPHSSHHWLPLTDAHLSRLWIIQELLSVARYKIMTYCNSDNLINIYTLLPQHPGTSSALATKWVYTILW